MSLSFRFHFRACLLASAACFLGACGSPEILPPTQHSITPPENVRLFQAEPSKYEFLGEITLPVTPEMRWDENGDSTAGFNALKARASAMGANGVLLMRKDGTYDLVVGAGYRDKFYQVPMRREPRAVLAGAIYVVKE